MDELRPLEVPLSGSTLIEASAGTGKTYTITTLFIRLLLEKNLSIDQILVVTFTIAATEELRIKIKQRLDDAIDWLANRPVDDETLDEMLVRYDREAAYTALSDVAARLDELAVYTIDAMCLRVLKDFAFDSKLPMRVDFIADDQYIRTLVAEDYWRRIVGGKDLLGIEELSQVGCPGRLLKLLAPLLQARGARVTPQADKVAAETLRRDLNKLFFRIQTQWEECSTRITQVLRNENKILNGNSYRAGTVEKLLVEVSEFFDVEKMPVRLPDKFELLTSQKMLASTNKGKQPPHHLFFELCGEFCEKFSSYETQRNAAVLLDARDYIVDKVDQFKRDRGLLHFEDLRIRLSEALAGDAAPALAEKIRQSWPYALVDESQDTDPQQNEIFQSVYKGQPDCGLFYIGDPKQAIYSFRGADVFTYMSAARAFDQAYTLGTNWRSSARLVNATNTLFTHQPNPFIFAEEIAYRTVSAAGKADATPFTLNGDTIEPLQFRILCDDESGREVSNSDAQAQAARSCAGEIAALLNHGLNGKAMIGSRPIVASDIAVLVRTHAESAIVQNTLRALGVKSASNSGRTVFTSDEASQLLIVLLAISCPTVDFIRRALITEVIGFTASDIDQLNRSEPKWDHRINQFVHYREIWLSKGLMTAVQSLFIELGVANRVLAYPGGERRLTNLTQLTELLQVRSREVSSTEELLDWFDRQITDGGIDDELLLRLESDENLVQIVTIHKSKGLEYPIVFIPFAWSIGRSAKTPNGSVVPFHDRSDFTAVIDLGSAKSEEHRALQMEEELSEFLRLMYVAITRAQHLCVLGWGKIFKMSALTAMGYLTRGQSDYISLKDLKVPNAQELVCDLANVVSTMPDGISFRHMREPVTAYVGSTSSTSLQSLEFSGLIDRNWCITSYTGLQSGDDSGLPDYDFSTASALEDAPEDSRVPLVEPQPLGAIARLPAGARTGQLLHEIFETVDFTDKYSIEVRVGEVLERYGSLDGTEDWQPVIMDIVSNTLNATLQAQNALRLCDLLPADRINELEFFFSIEKLDVHKLRAVLEHEERYKATASGLKFSSLTGLMRGFIDMVGRKDGQYFIVDYKSNLLGSFLENYGTDELAPVISSHRYDLQYLIYTVALHRFLKTRDPTYNYNTDFAGVFYLFVRGMKPGGSCGVWSDKPPVELIERLDQCFSAGCSH